LTTVLLKIGRRVLTGGKKNSRLRGAREKRPCPGGRLRVFAMVTLVRLLRKVNRRKSRVMPCHTQKQKRRKKEEVEIAVNERRTRRSSNTNGAHYQKQKGTCETPNDSGRRNS